MAAFDLEISNSFPEGMDGEFGGPGAGGHAGADWFEAFGRQAASGATSSTPTRSRAGDRT